MQNKSLVYLSEVKIYKMVLSGRIKKFPYGFWKSIEQENIKNVILFLFRNYLRWSNENIIKYANFDLFREYRLSGMLKLFFNGSHLQALDFAFSDINYNFIKHKKYKKPCKISYISHNIHDRIKDILLVFLKNDEKFIENNINNKDIFKNRFFMRIFRKIGNQHFYLKNMFPEKDNIYILSMIDIFDVLSNTQYEKEELYNYILKLEEEIK